MNSWSAKAFAVIWAAVALMAVGCSSGPEPEPVARDNVGEIVKLFEGIREGRQKGETVFPKVRKGLLDLRFVEIGRLINLLGPSPVFIAGHTVGDGKGIALERTEYLYLHYGPDVLRITILRQILASSAKSAEETARIRDVLKLSPETMIRGESVRARLSSPDWRMMADAFDESDIQAAKRSPKLRSLIHLRFLESLETQKGWLPGERDRALMAADLRTFLARLDSPAYTKPMQERADRVLVAFEKWAGGEGESEKGDSWKKLLSLSLLRTGDIDTGGTDRCIELCCLLKETGHSSTLPRRYSRPGLVRNYTATFSKALFEGMLANLTAGGERAGVTACAVLSRVDPYLHAVFLENHRPALYAGLVSGLSCQSPVIRARSALGLEHHSGRLLAGYDPLAPPETVAREAKAVETRFKRTGFKAGPEENARQTSDRRVRRTLDVLASVAHLTREGKHGPRDMAELMNTVRKRKLQIGLAAGGPPFQDRDGFIYTISPRAGGFQITATGALWKTDDPVCYFWEERAAKVGVKREEGLREK